MKYSKPSCEKVKIERSKVNRFYFYITLRNKCCLARNVAEALSMVQQVTKGQFTESEEGFLVTWR